MVLVKLNAVIILSFMVTSVLSQEELNNTFSNSNQKTSDDLIESVLSNIDQPTIAPNEFTTEGPNKEETNTDPPDTIPKDEIIIPEELGSSQIETSTGSQSFTTNDNEIFESNITEETTNEVSTEIDELLEITTETNQIICPETCTCHNEAESESLHVDCFNRSLTDIPELDPSTSVLNIQNNLISEIPEAISNLKQLKVLNASNNIIEKIANNSIRNLSELKILNLSNNKLLEFPDELKYSNALNKLKELDIGGNDIKLGLTIEDFENFKSLQKLTLPTSEKEFVKVLCNTYNNTLELECVGLCKDWTNGCFDKKIKTIEADFNSAKLPEIIAIDTIYPNDNINKVLNPKEPTVLEEKTDDSNNTDSLQNVLVTMVAENDVLNTEEVGATTSTVRTNSGSMDKNIIGIVLVCMIVIVAAIAIKMNWTSIASKCGSNRNNNSRTVRANGNGVVPEEVPLQDKDQSPPV